MNLRNGLALFQELDDRHGRTKALRDLGDVLQAMGRPGEARAAWREALAICQELRVPEADEVRGRLAALPAETPEPTGHRTSPGPP